MDVGGTTEKRRAWRKIMMQAVCGGVLGFAGAVAVNELLDRGTMGVFSLSEEIAGLVAVTYLLMGGLVGLGAASPWLGSRFLDCEDEDEVREQRKLLLGSGVAMLLLGLALLVLTLAAPQGPVPAPMALVLAVAAVGIGTAISVWQLRAMDELMRAMSNGAAAYGFYLLLYGAGGWAMAAHLGYAPAPQPLDWLTMLLTAPLLGAFVAAGRRGLLAPR